MPVVPGISDMSQQALRVFSINQHHILACQYFILFSRSNGILYLSGFYHLAPHTVCTWLQSVHTNQQFQNVSLEVILTVQTEFPLGLFCMSC